MDSSDRRGDALCRQVSRTPPKAPTARFSVSERVARRLTPSTADAANIGFARTDGSGWVRVGRVVILSHGISAIER